MSKLGRLSFAFSIISILAFGIVRSLMTSGWMPFYTILLAFFVLFLIAGLIIDRKFFADFFAMKTTKHGVNMGAMILSVLAIVVLLNYIAVKRNKTWDFSQAQTNTLSDQSTQIVKSLKSELKILYFYKDGTQGIDQNRKAFRELVKKYQDQSNEVRLEFYEVNQHPKLAEDYGVTKGGGTAFVEYQGRKNRLEKVDEQEITQAIIKVTRSRNKTVYFVTGHGEFNIEDSQEAAGLHAFKLLIEGNSFVVKSVNLPTNPQIPQDADAVLVVGPTQKFSDYEVKALENYLKIGGNLMIALELAQGTGLEGLLARAAIKPENHFIKSSFMGIGYVDGPAQASGFSLNSGITKVFTSQRDMVAMNWPLSLKSEKVPEGLNQDILVKTDENATAFPTKKLEAGKFPQGPFQLGMEVKGRWPGGEKDFQLVVYADAEFMTNEFLYQRLNRDLALNSVSQLTKEENLISITPRQVQKTQLRVTTAKMGSFYIFIIAIPLSLFVLSILFFLRRRKG